MVIAFLDESMVLLLHMPIIVFMKGWGELCILKAALTEQILRKRRKGLRYCSIFSCGKYYLR
jgi:hypothetical protein